MLILRSITACLFRYFIISDTSNFAVDLQLIIYFSANFPPSNQLIINEYFLIVSSFAVRGRAKFGILHCAFLSDRMLAIVYLAHLALRQ